MFYEEGNNSSLASWTVISDSIITWDLKLCFLLRNVSLLHQLYPLLGVILVPYDLASPKQNVCTHEIDQRIPVIVEDALRWPTMNGTYSKVLGWLGAALGILLGGEMDFSTVDPFEMDLETGLNLVLVNLNGAEGTGALREPIDSNRSFPVKSTFGIVLASLETLRRMLDFKSNASCFGFG